MRTTLDLPDDVLCRAKITAVERGSTLRQIVIDALQRELGIAASRSKRLTSAPVRLAPDAPLRSSTPKEIKRLDAEAVAQADEAKARAQHR